jgi:hypothetical protein
VVANDRVNVLFIAGSGRSGSTLVHRILGQLPGFVSVGELRFLWERGVVQGRPCGCGVPVPTCPFWSDVLDRAFGADSRSVALDVMARQAVTSRARHVPAMLADRGRGRVQATRRGDYPRYLAQLLQAVADVAGARVVVDSSKLPAYGYMLQTLPAVDLSVLHLIRDPRATAYSWRRRKAEPGPTGPRLTDDQGVMKSAALWALWNATADAFWHSSDAYRRMRYEDFTREPAATLAPALEALTEGRGELPFTDARTVHLGIDHSVAGNPNRLESGLVSIEPDEEWTTAMRKRDRALVTAVTAPLLARYGYPLRPVGRDRVRDGATPQQT